jgi:hypothetical protein
LPPVATMLSRGALLLKNRLNGDALHSPEMELRPWRGGERRPPARHSPFTLPARTWRGRSRWGRYNRGMDAQIALCAKYGVPFVHSPAHWKVGVARNVRDGTCPLNGLRHPPEGDTTGWFIWAGDDLPGDPGFFVPLHVAHLDEWCPSVIPYLGLPPGWRFLIAPGYEDVWEDRSLLGVQG